MSYFDSYNDGKLTVDRNSVRLSVLEQPMSYTFEFCSYILILIRNTYWDHGRNISDGERERDLFVENFSI
jgi:hypothetical protein